MPQHQRASFICRIIIAPSSRDFQGPFQGTLKGKYTHKLTSAKRIFLENIVQLAYLFRHSHLAHLFNAHFYPIVFSIHSQIIVSYIHINYFSSCLSSAKCALALTSLARQLTSLSCSRSAISAYGSSSSNRISSISRSHGSSPLGRASANPLFSPSTPSSFSNMLLNGILSCCHVSSAFGSCISGLTGLLPSTHSDC